MKAFIKKTIRRAMHIIRPCTLPHAFSQEGEDLILARIFENKPDGFYVDVGAHHPIRYSNTYLFYLHGWRGINIDAAPGSMDAFKQLRANDINVETAIGEHTGSLLFHIFNDPAINTFDVALAKERDGQAHYRLMETKKMQMRTLAQVLEEYLPPNKSIDFLSVDVEGLDLAILRSNDWKRFSPEYLLAEDYFCASMEEALQSPITTFLRSVGYALHAKTVHTQIYKRQSA